MRIYSESRIPHSLERVFSVYRDQLFEVVPYLDDIREIQVVAREELDGAVRLHNVWASDTEIPAVAQRLIEPEHLLWDDYATWYAADQRCEWRIETRVFQAAFSCSGSTRLIAEGDATKVLLEGELKVDIAKVKGVPRLLARTIGPQVEKFIVALIKPNLEQTNTAIAAFLSAQS